MPLKVDLEKLSEFIEIWERNLKTTPHPEESCIEGLPSPNEVLIHLKEIQRTGKIQTDAEKDSYEFVTDYSKPKS